jgi:RNA polymerase-binding transcription factor DksA
MYPKRYNSSMIEIRQTEAYFQWFDSLRDRKARARINARIRRLSLGNFGDVKPIGEGVSELRIDFGPGSAECISCSATRRWWFCLPAAINVLKTGTSRKR